jgi:hypothetical protein
MGMRWFRLHAHDVLSKRYREMPDWVFHFLIDFQAFAAELGQDGLLPPVEEMSDALRPVPVAKLNSALKTLAEVGEAEWTENGWFLTHFQEEQVSEGYERQMRFKEKKRAVTASNAKERPISYSSSASSSVSSSGDGGVGEGDVFAAYEQGGCKLTPMDSEALGELIDEHGAALVSKCIAYAPGKPINYLRKVLETWKRDGGPKPTAARGAQKGRSNDVLAAFAAKHGVTNG